MRIWGRGERGGEIKDIGDDVEENLVNLIIVILVIVGDNFGDRVGGYWEKSLRDLS